MVVEVAVVEASAAAHSQTLVGVVVVVVEGDRLIHQHHNHHRHPLDPEITVLVEVVQY